jgi:galactokinase
MIEIFAPARICLFGDHQDYLGLPVITCAIDRYIKLTATENTKRLFEISMPDIGEERVIPITENVASNNEQDFFMKALEVLARQGCIPNTGYDIIIIIIIIIIISGNIPINAGLSSSSAIIVAWTTFLLKAFGKPINIVSELIAKLTYRIEVLEFNNPGGLMNEHHEELKVNLKITVPLIDTMIDGAINNGALGAKIVGSGGGGCIVAISSPENENRVIQGVLNDGAKSAYKVEIVGGVL